MALSSGDSLAGRAAPAESHLVAATRKWLISNGIKEETFIRTGTDLAKAADARTTVKRSEDTLIVKNLPPGISDFILQSTFQPFGPLTRVLLAPSQTVAVVQ